MIKIIERSKITVETVTPYYTLIYNYTIGTDTNTKEYNILYDNLNDGDNKGRFDAINECLASEELRDMVTLKKLMESYAVEDYVTKQLFVPENMRQ